jgi:type II secretory pathway pseudopilin PulG
MNRIYIILGVAVLVMIGVVWKSNSDRKAREEALALQTQQHNQKMAQIESRRRQRDLP